MMNLTGNSMFPPVVKNLLIINGLFFMAQQAFPIINAYLALFPVDSDQFMAHQLITSGFLHANFEHILFNMFGLWMFGKNVEQLIGSKRFLTLYMSSIVGSGLLHIIMSPNAVAVGASGGLFGILAAFALLLPNVQILIYFLFPVKAKYLAIGYAALELYQGLRYNPADNVAHFAHLGGMIVAVILLKLIWKIPKLM